MTQSVSGHGSTLPSRSELSKVEETVTTDSMEHTPQVSLLCFSLLFCGYEDANVSVKLVGTLRRYSAEQVLIFSTVKKRGSNQ